MSSAAPIVFVVDDDAGVRAATQRLLKSVGLTAETFAIPQDFLKRPPHDADNLLNTVTDQLGRTTTYTYDVNDNPTSITWLSGTPNAITASASYDGVFSQPVSITDPVLNTTSMFHDSAGRLAQRTDPLGHTTSINTIISTSSRRSRTRCRESLPSAMTLTET